MRADRVPHHAPSTPPGKRHWLASTRSAWQLRRPRASFTPSFAHAVRLLRQSLRGPAVLLIFSAGDANTIAELYLNAEADSA